MLSSKYSIQIQLVNENTDLSTYVLMKFMLRTNKQRQAANLIAAQNAIFQFHTVDRSKARNSYASQATPSLDTSLYHQGMHCQTIWPLPPLLNLTEFCPHNKSRIWSFYWRLLCWYWCSGDEHPVCWATEHCSQNSQVCLYLLTTRKEKASLTDGGGLSWIAINIKSTKLLRIIYKWRRQM